MPKNRLDYQAHLSRHSHDISAGFSASQSTGMIIPQYFHVLNPGDTIYYQSKMFARLQEVQNAFLGEIDLHIDSFFVPLQMLFTPFGQVFAQTDDFLTSLLIPASFASRESFPLLALQAINDALDLHSTDSNDFESQGRAFARLLNALDCNPLSIFDDVLKEQMAGERTGKELDDQICHNPNVSPWIFAAYQAIYQKYYRNDEFERLAVDSYNFDYFYGQPTFNSAAFTYLRYVQRPKDYFTDVRISPISSAVNKFMGSGSRFPENGSSIDSVICKVDSFLDPQSTGYFVQPNVNVIGSPSNPNSFDSISISSFNTPANTNNNYLNAANIRALFAVDKFARIYGRADKTYDDQILAHFGIHIPHDVKHDLTHLSHYRAVLQSDPIYSTSNVQNNDGDLISVIGQVGGQGSVDFKSSQDKFTAPVHGVFMIVAYFVTKPRYFGTFSKLHLLSNRLSFPIPEYDKLGAQPMYGFEANPLFLQSDTYLGTRIGWQNRYSQFKEKYNRTSLTFYSGTYGHGGQSYNIYAPWIISRMPFGRDLNQSGLPVTSTSRMVAASSLFESPFALDSIMVKKYIPSFSDVYFSQPHEMFQSDPILTEYFCNAKLVSWMSETGEPDL